MGIIQGNAFLGCQNICVLQLATPTDVKRDIKFTAVEQKLLIELCRTDGLGAMDRVGMGWQWKQVEFYIVKNNFNSTVLMTCLYTFLKRNDYRISKNTKQGKGGKRRIS